MITKKDIIITINKFFKEFRNKPFKDNFRLKREAINLSFNVYDNLIQYITKYHTKISTYRPKNKQGITITFRMYGIAVVSVMVYMDYKSVSVYRFGIGKEEDYQNIEHICDICKRSNL